MTARTSTKWLCGLIVAGWVADNGLAQDDPGRSQITVSSQETVVTTPSPTQIDASDRPTNSSAPQQILTLSPIVLSQAGKQGVPSSNFISSWYLEVVRLAQAGVDETIIGSFISSAGTFNLGPEEIIYLSDLGVSSAVVKSMIQHDQDLNSEQLPLNISTAPAPGAAVQLHLPSGFLAADHRAGPQIAAAATSPQGLTIPVKHQAAWTPDNSDVQPAFDASEEAPEQPESRYPVRLPYPVKLSDPIIMLKLPCL